MAGAGQVEGCAGIIDEFSKCWGYLDHLGKIAKNASYMMEGTMEGTNEGFNIEGIGKVGFLAGNRIEKSQVDFIGTLVEKIMIYYKRAQEPKVNMRCNHNLMRKCPNILTLENVYLFMFLISWFYCRHSCADYIYFTLLSIQLEY